MNALHEQFVLEARELIHQATDDLIAVEREGFAAQRIDRVFRAFHTLKGSAAMIGLPAMNLTLHAAEDLLAAIHAGRLEVTSAIVDAALACLDQVSQWVDDFAARESLPSHAGEDARATAERLRDLLPENRRKEQTTSVPNAAAISTDRALPEWISGLIQRARMSGRVQEAATALVAVFYEPLADCFFNGDDPLQLMRQVPNLLAFHIEAREAWQPLTELNPFACNLRLQGLSAGNRTEIADIFRLVPDQVRVIDVPVRALRPDPDTGAGNGDAAGLVLAVIEEQRRIVGVSGSSEGLAGRIGAAARVAVNALRHALRADLSERIERAGAAATARGDTVPLVSALDEILEALRLGSTVGGRNGGAGRPGGPRTEEAERVADRSLRVDQSKIDALVNLAGELVVVKNGFAHLAKQVEQVFAGHELAQEVRRTHDAVERLVGDMHSAILQLRMVPASRVLRSFPRLVRDMAQRLEKRVELVTEGEATELDKAAVDRLFEPLLHLVRNAVDHGIETPEQRRAAGKSETATITIQASRTGDRFVVGVIDDGRGIDPAAVRRKARERGLIATDELDALTDEQTLDLIFTPGFSTAVEISDISGRGVGMDVVRSTVEQIGGRVSLTSRVGSGTAVRLDLPVNIALTRIMIVEAGGQVFGIPMDAVAETLRLAPDRISQIKSNEAFILRSRIVPICSLAELMGLPESRAAAADVRLVLVTEIGGRIVALAVDAIRDRLEVVLKPMQGVLSSARGYSGTTLLGDGSVLLVLDLKEVLP